MQRTQTGRALSSALEHLRGEGHGDEEGGDEGDAGGNAEAGRQSRGLFHGHFLFSRSRRVGPMPAMRVFRGRRPSDPEYQPCYLYRML